MLRGGFNMLGVNGVNGIKRIGLGLLAVGVGLSMNGCRHEKPNVIYMPDMVYSPARKAQKDAMWVPVAGTVSRDYEPYPYKDIEVAGKELKNPLKPTAEGLARGKEQFRINCAVCHALDGKGDGPIVPKFPHPPSLVSDKVRNWPDGKIFHVTQMGQNLMPSYAAQVPAADRWLIVNYIRVLQRADHPTAEDLKVLKASDTSQESR